MAGAVSVAIAVIATTTTFLLAYALLWRPVGVASPERLVHVALMDDQGRVLPLPSTLTDAIRSAQAFDGVCAFVTPSSTTRLADSVRQRSVLALSDDCFTTLGTAPAIGRLFSAADGASHEPVAVLAHRTWQREFGGRPDVLGARVTVDGQTYVVIGVTERRFDGLLLGFPPHVLLPLDPYRVATGGGEWYRANVFARRRADVDIRQARQELEALWQRWVTSSLPGDLPALQRQNLVGSRLHVAPASGGMDFVLRDRFRRPVLALLALGVLVAAISLTNLGHLLLARLVDRQQELAVRVALGASRQRLALDAAREGLLGVAVGGLAGAVLATALSRALVSLLSGIYPSLELATPLTGLALGLIALTTGAALALTAAITVMMARMAPLSMWPVASSRVVGGPRLSRRLLTSTAVLLTMVLVSVNLLGVRTLQRSREGGPDIRTENVVAARLASLPERDRRDPPGYLYYETMVDRLTALPGVGSVSLTRFSPFFARPYVEPVGAAIGDAPISGVEQHTVSEAFFETLRIPVLEGRPFARGDDRSREPVAILSQSLAGQLFGAGEAIGRQVHVGNQPAPLTVVGVVGDVALLEPRRGPTRALYRSFWQLPPDWQSDSDLLVHLEAGTLATQVGPIAAVVEQGGREYPMMVRTLSEQYELAFTEERLVASAGAGFAIVGLLVSMLGVYTLISHFVSCRRRELAVRAAVGASPAALRWLAVREAGTALLPGWLVGLPCAAAAYHASAGLVADGQGEDMAALVLTAAAIVGVSALAATVGPGRRAARTNPMEALSDR